MLSFVFFRSSALLFCFVVSIFNIVNNLSVFFVLVKFERGLLEADHEQYDYPHWEIEHHNFRIANFC